MFKFELGSKVRSKISGFQGIATSRSEHLNGCHRYWVAPPVDKDGKLPDGYWLDEAEIEVIEPPQVTQQDTERGGFPSRVK
ncbi:MAG: hypothetical protein ABL888_13265 [Pirellulaceae bacterium]